MHHANSYLQSQHRKISKYAFLHSTLSHDLTYVHRISCKGEVLDPASRFLFRFGSEVHIDVLPRYLPFVLLCPALTVVGSVRISHNSACIIIIVRCFTSERPNQTGVMCNSQVTDRASTTSDCNASRILAAQTLAWLLLQDLSAATISRSSWPRAVGSHQL